MRKWLPAVSNRIADQSDEISSLSVEKRKRQRLSCSLDVGVLNISKAELIGRVVF